MKQYILFAGVNGSGKSTLYHTIGEYLDLPRINTDEIVATFGDWRNYSDVVKAGKIAVKSVKSCFDNGESFVQETTLCGRSILGNIRYAKENGYQIIVFYVGVNNVDIAKTRIASRVNAGGHGIPDKDVERRFDESFKNLKKIIPYCDIIHFYDNTEIFRYFASIKNGSFGAKENLPEWFKTISEDD